MTALSDAEQHRFTSIRSRMLYNVSENLPSIYVEQSGAKSRSEFRQRLTASDSILAIIDCCAYEALKIEQERSSGRA